MKNVKTFKNFIKESLSNPDYEDQECVISGEIEYDLMFEVSKDYKGGVTADMFESFVNDIERLLDQNSKKLKKYGVKSCEIYTPLNNPDDSYQDWNQEENGDYTVGSMAFNVTCDISSFYTMDDSEDFERAMVQELAPNEKEVMKIVKRYKFVDDNSYYAEYVDSDLSNSCHNY